VLSGSVAPDPLDLKGLFQMDMDDPIWFDTGLGEEGEDTTVLA
jgi:hypothetical protein